MFEPYGLIIFCLGVIFFITAIYGLHWSSKHQQFKRSETIARSIFHPEEPEGTCTDQFPNHATKT